MKLFRIGQQWINLDLVSYINVITPDPNANPPIAGAFEFTFANGHVQKITAGWNDMASFSKVFSPFAQALKSSELS